MALITPTAPAPMMAMWRTLLPVIASRLARYKILADRHGARVEEAMQDRRLAGGEGALEGRRKILGALDPLAMAAKGLGVEREVGILQLRSDHAARIVALLMHANGAVLTVVDDDHDHGRAILRGGRELLAVHQEAAVTGKGDHDAVGILPFREHGRRHAIAHRSRGGGELGGESVETVMAMQPAGIIAGAVADDRILRQPVAQPCDDLTILEGARELARRAGPLQVVGMGLRRLALPGGRGLWLQRRDGLRKGHGARLDRERRLVDPA